MSDKYENASDETRDGIVDDAERVLDDQSGGGQPKQDDAGEFSRQGTGEKHDWEKRFKDTQAKLTEVSQAKSELEKRLAVLEGKLEVLASDRASREADNREDPLSFLEDENFDEKFLEKPREGLKHVVNVLGAALVNMDRRYREQLETLAAEIRKPKGEIAEAIKSLRSDPDFADFSDEQLAVLVKKGVGRSGGDKREYPGGNATARRVDSSSLTDAELERQTKAIFKKLYGEEE